MDVDAVRSALTQTERLWSRHEVLATPSPAPARAGVYAWFFASLPGSVGSAGCIQVYDMTLLYLGIAPSSSSSSGDLRKRIRIHYRGNASRSTLRRSLGVLLADDLGLELRRHGASERLHFGDGEAPLSAWMAENAFVTWVANPEPWLVEATLIRSLPLPLNIDHSTHPFSPVLSQLRREAVRRAKEFLPEP